VAAILSSISRWLSKLACLAIIRHSSARSRTQTLSSSIEAPLSILSF
jgi:hypothetical protein